MLSDARWKVITESEFAWERNAPEFIRKRLPDHEPYRNWTNFEFVAVDGKDFTAPGAWACPLRLVPLYRRAVSLVGRRRLELRTR